LPVPTLPSSTLFNHWTFSINLWIRLVRIPQLKGVSGGFVPPCNARSTSSAFFSQNACASSRAVESLELNPAHLFSKPVGSSLIFGEPAVRFHFIVEVPVH
jgi:hypothetical protein